VQSRAILLHPVLVVTLMAIVNTRKHALTRLLQLVEGGHLNRLSGIQGRWLRVEKWIGVVDPLNVGDSERVPKVLDQHDSIHHRDFEFKKRHRQTVEGEHLLAERHRLASQLLKHRRVASNEHVQVYNP
jgi:hypothetical protein